MDEKNSDREMRQHLEEFYQRLFFPYHHPYVGHYFRSLYNILKMIEDANLPSVEAEYRYAKVVRSELSAHEEVLIFHNCLSPLGEQLFELVLRYNLLKTLNPDELMEYPTRPADQGPRPRQLHPHHRLYWKRLFPEDGNPSPFILPDQIANQKRDMADFLQALGFPDPLATYKPQG